MTITRETADRAILAWKQVKEGKELTIKWDLILNSGEEALILCEQEKLVHLFVETVGDILYLDSRYNYDIVDIRDYQLTPYHTEWDYLEPERDHRLQWKDDMLHIILDNGDELAFKIVEGGQQ